jgi:hypothetical protein
MSRYFFYKLFPFVKALSSNAKPNILTFLGSSIAITYIHGTFALATNEIEEICVAKKYKYVSNGFTNFMIVDTNGRHFNVNNSFWYWKWDAIEDWTNILKECKGQEVIAVSYYGYRIPFLGMFPNVVEVSSNSVSKLEEKKEKKEKRRKSIDILLSHIHI